MNRKEEARLGDKDEEGECLVKIFVKIMAENF